MGGTNVGGEYVFFSAGGRSIAAAMSLALTEQAKCPMNLLRLILGDNLQRLI